MNFVCIAQVLEHHILSYDEYLIIQHTWFISVCKKYVWNVTEEKKKIVKSKSFLSSYGQWFKCVRFKEYFKFLRVLITLYQAFWRGCCVYLEHVSASCRGSCVSTRCATRSTWWRWWRRRWTRTSRSRSASTCRHTWSRTSWGQTNCRVSGCVQYVAYC